MLFPDGKQRSRDERRGEGRGGERRERWIEDDAAGRRERERAAR